MNKTHVWLLLILSNLHAQTDTIIFNEANKSFLVRYIGSDRNGNDTVVTMEYTFPVKIDPIITCRVSTIHGSLYKYSYRVMNGPKAEQNLNTFMIRLDSTTKNTKDGSNDGWDNYLMMRAVEINGVEYAEPFWVWQGDQGLEKNWKIDQCAMFSTGLPRIGESYSQAVSKIIIMYGGGPKYSDIELSIPSMQEFPKDYVFTHTLTPWNPPKERIPRRHLDSLHFFIEQAFDIGWISKALIRDKYFMFIDSVQRNLATGDLRHSMMYLDSIAIHAETDRGLSAIREEFECLLTMNARHIKDRMEHISPSR